LFLPEYIIKLDFRYFI